MRILGRISSINVRKVLWAADELGLSYQREDWGLPLRDPKTPEFRALNPNGQVPVLVEDDGFALWESNAILLHLAEAHGALLPASGRARSVALQWLGWQATDLNNAYHYAFVALVRRAADHDDPAQIARSAERWRSAMRILDGQLEKTGAFVAGDTFTVADIALGLCIHRWYGTPIERPGLAHVARYYDMLRARPQARPHFDPAVP
jgi:glutathione S-transferase